MTSLEKHQDTAAQEASSQHEEHAEKSNAGLSTYRRVFHYADRKSQALYIIAFICAIISGAGLPLMDLVFGKTVTSFTGFGTGGLSPDEFRSQANQYALIFVYLFIGKFCLTYVWTVAVNIAALRTTRSMRVDFLRQLLRQDIAYFDRESNAAVAIQISTNGNLVNIGIAEKLGLAIQSIATFVAAFAVAFGVQWKLTLITLSIVPTIVIVVGICIGIALKIEARILDIYANAGSLAEDVFSNIRNVHAFWVHRRLAAKYNELLLKARHEGRRNKILYAILFSTEFFCVNSGYALAFWQGIRMYVSGEISQAGQVVTVIFAVIVAANALTQLAPQFEIMAKAGSAAHSLFEIIDRKSEIDALSTEGVVPSKCAGEIQISNLEFAYPSRPNAPVLQGVDLNLPAGQTTALVGASGSGKSTIIGLLERWYNPTAGAISLDGVEIDKLNVIWLRTNIRLVQQEPVLFNGTVFDNVAFGLVGTTHIDASHADQMKLVEEACRSAYAHDFITELPEGYDTQIGERASRLSGGQKQRIAIARSIISNPAVLLLDEATSALDPQAERIVQEALENVSHTRTTLIIAHKLSTVRKADNIAVMSNGAIVEQGTHEQLIELGGHYARLVKAQDLRQRAEGDIATDGSPEGDHKGESTAQENLKVISQAIHNVEGDVKATGFHYSLPKCLWLLAKQQPSLWPWMFFIVLLSTLGGGTYPALAVLFARAVTAFQLPSEEALSQGNFWGLMFFIVAIIIAIIFFSLGWTTALVGGETTYFYRLQMFEDVMNQDVEYFDREENTTGALVSRLSSQPTDLQELIGFNVALIIIIVVNITASSILAIAVGWKLGLTIALSALPVMVIFGYLRIRLQFRLEDQVSERFSSSTALASEAVAAIRTISSLALETNVLTRYEQHLAEIQTQSIATFFRTMIWFSASQSVNFLAIALGFWYGSRLLSTGEYDSTQFFTVFICVIFAGEGAAQFFSYSTSFTKAQKAANDLLWLHAVKPRIRKADDSKDDDINSDYDEKVVAEAAEIGCDSLTFSYPLRPQYRVLRGITLKAAPGQSLAFVGASGCGKTTMIALLERFYDPTSGTISYNGTDIKSLDPQIYRSNIALVQQEPTLYQGTIRENIAMGLERHASEEDVIEASKRANIHEFIISLSDGFNTLVGTRGIQLSGGQRQRIAIARALIRKPKLLLLDEATSALDSESERLVQSALQEASQGCTTIAVAHRLSTVRDCDCIFVFLGGRVVETGTHDELLERKGVYYEMCLGQSLDREG